MFLIQLCGPQQSFRCLDKRTAISSESTKYKYKEGGNIELRKILRLKKIPKHKNILIRQISRRKRGIARHSSPKKKKIPKHKNILFGQISRRKREIARHSSRQTFYAFQLLGRQLQLEGKEMISG